MSPFLYFNSKIQAHPKLAASLSSLLPPLAVNALTTST
jgi:hypothetical protein